MIRTLPGILESGLWRQLESFAAAPTRALVTDVGNDILYGFSAEQTLAWVAEAVERLQKFTKDIVLTDLPLQHPTSVRGKVPSCSGPSSFLRAVFPLERSCWPPSR